MGKKEERMSGGEQSSWILVVSPEGVDSGPRVPCKNLWLGVEGVRQSMEGADRRYTTRKEGEEDRETTDLSAVEE